MPCIGAFILASLVENNKLGAITDKVVPKTGIEVLQTSLIAFGSKPLKHFWSNASLCAIV
jgi:hypothetical protein